MKWRVVKQYTPDPLLVWHKKFAWLPVRFSTDGYNDVNGFHPEPNRAWLEFVMRKGKRFTWTGWPGYYFEYRSMEDGERFPQQFGPGADG